MIFYKLKKKLSFRWKLYGLRKDIELVSMFERKLVDNIGREFVSGYKNNVTIKTFICGRDTTVRDVLSNAVLPENVFPMYGAGKDELFAKIDFGDGYVVFLKPNRARPNTSIVHMYNGYKIDHFNILNTNIINKRIRRYLLESQEF